MTADPLSIVTRGLFSSLTGVTRGLLQEELHPRTEIRKHITAAIQFETAVDGRVYANPIAPVDGERLAEVGPEIHVYTGDDPVAPEKTAAQIYRQHLEVFVEIAASSKLPDQQDVLDAIALAVQLIVVRDETQGGHAAETEFMGTTFDQSGEGKVPFAALRLTFRVGYDWSAVDLVGDALKRIGADWDLPTPDGTPEAQDEVTFTQE